MSTTFGNLWFSRFAMVFAIVVTTAAPIRAAEPHYQAKWTDGTLSTGNEVYDWTDNGSRARLDNQPLFSGSRSIRWLRDQTREISEPQSAALFFLGGDCLPGTIVDYCADDDAAMDAEPHLRVEPSVAVELPGAERFRPLRILTDSLERIVWSSGQLRPLRPSTAFLKDGRQFEYRGLHWKKEGVQLLLAERTAFVSFYDLSELHLPRQDRWKWLCRRLAKLTPSLNSMLMQIHGPEGLCATSSRERCSMRTTKGRTDSAHWAQFIQPDWSLDPLVIRHTEISLRTFFRPHELPLTWLTPAASRHRGVLSGGWDQHQIDRNVQGGPLRNSGQFFAWGLGVHAYHDLVFELPEGVSTFQSFMGLDEIAGNGGCARGRVIVEGRNEPMLFEGSALVGSKKHKNSGVLELKLPRGKSTLLHLIADDAASDSPAGADPFDVRDMFDWLEPMIACDSQWLQRQINASMDSIIPGWKIEDRYNVDWRAENVVDINERPVPICRTAIIPVGEITMSRTVRIRPRYEQLQVVLGHAAHDGQQASLSILVNHRPLANVPIWGWQSPEGYRPVTLDLSEYVGREVEIELRLRSDKHHTPIIWCGSSWHAKITKPVVTVTSQ